MDNPTCEFKANSLVFSDPSEGWVSPLPRTARDLLGGWTSVYPSHFLPVLEQLMQPGRVSSHFMWRTLDTPGLVLENL